MYMPQKYSLIRQMCYLLEDLIVSLPHYYIHHPNRIQLQAVGEESSRMIIIRLSCVCGICIVAPPLPIYIEPESEIA